MDLSKTPAPEPKLQGINPANPPPVQLSVEEARQRRIPFSSAKRKLEAPEIPGYYLYWFLASNVAQALQAAYEFVSPEEACINQNNFADDVTASGNTDLGNRVSIMTKGAEGPERIYLMKLRLELHHDDQQQLWQENKTRLEAIFAASPYWDGASNQQFFRPHLVGNPEGGGMSRNQDPTVYMRNQPILNMRASAQPKPRGRTPLFNR